MADNKAQDIKIAKVELLEWGMKLSTESGMVFNLSEKTKDGRTSNAWEQYQNMGLKIGSSVNVWYAETPNAHGGTSRYIRSFREVSTKPAQVAPPTPIAPSQPKYEATGDFKPKDEVFWDKKAFKQCLWGYWLERYPDVLFKAKSADGTLGQVEMDLVWQVFNQIEEDANKRFDLPDVPF